MSDRIQDGIQAPEMSFDGDDVPRVKRFKHQSYTQSLKEVHLPSALIQKQLDQEIGDNDSHFRLCLDHWRQLNLSPAFLKFSSQVNQLSASLPLLLHNWKEIVEFWYTALDAADDEALRALLDLFQKLAHDLRTTLAPVYPDVLARLLKFLPKQITAPALTELLSSLSSLFKYLLVPSTDVELIQSSWTQVRETLPKCLPEVQRAVAEVWGSVLRRFKTAAREIAVVLVARDVDGAADASAWIFVFACKSVSQTLHTSTLSMITPLLAHHLSCEDGRITHTLVRRVLTAFIHHVKSAEEFSAIGDLLVSTLVATTRAESPDEERIRRVVEVVAVPCAVRHGSRLTQKHLMAITAEFPKITITPTLHTALLKALTASLTSGDMTIWLGVGREAIEHGWTDASFGIKLMGALAEGELKWAGWKPVALPGILRRTPELLEKEPQAAIGLLARLNRECKLGEVDPWWKQCVEKWAVEKLVAWELTEEKASELHDILALATFVPSIAPHLVRIVDSTIALPADPKASYQESFANSAWVLGVSMQTLATRRTGEWAHLADLSAWTQACVQRWSWSEQVLAGLVSVVRLSPADVQPFALQEVYPSLHESLMSHSRPLRLNTLRLLSSRAIGTNQSEQEVLKRCLQGEEVALDVQGVRERVLRIGRVGQAVKEGDVQSADMCARWLISQLKVNLRPLWSPAAEAIASLSKRFGDGVWTLMFAELQALSEGHRVDQLPEWMSEDLSSADDLNDPWEEEKSWRDPSAHELRSAIVKWIGEELSRKEALQSQISKERLDHVSYELQLLSTLGECPLLAEKHNREFVPFFLSFAGPEAESRISRTKLVAWLTLFSKFVNPKALYQTSSLHELYMSLLSHPDRSMQTVSLTCILSYKSPHLVPHENRIRTLLDDTRWRDELSLLDLSQVEVTDRKELVSVVMRLLFGMMLEKRGRTRGADRRAAVLGAFGGCTDGELGLLVDLMLKPLGSESSARRETPFEVLPVAEGATEKQQSGFLTLLGDVLRNLGPRLVSYWPALLGTTIDLIATSQSRIETAQQNGNAVADDDVEADDEAEDAAEGSTSKATRSIRQLGLKRFADFFRNPASFDFKPYMKGVFTAFVSPRIGVLDIENTQAPSALLELFYVWTLKDQHVKFLVEYDTRTLPKIYDCLVATNVKPAVVSRIFDIVDRLLAFSTVDADIQETVIKPNITRLLDNLALLVERTKGVAAIATPLGQRQISILSEIAQYSTSATQASTLFTLFSPLLRKPPKFVPEKVKVDLLKIMSNLMLLIPDLADRTTPVYTKTYELLSQLWQSLRSRNSRLALVAAFNQLAALDVQLQPLAVLLESLNAYSPKRMDEPDFDRRLDAFADLNERMYKTLSISDWLPILYNALHFIQDAAELAVRNNASFAMRHFVDLVANPALPEYEALFTKMLYPGIKNGLRSRNELVRSEVLSVIAYAVTICDNVPPLHEMKVLLGDGDEEVNFFNNIQHVQVHRRARALRKFSDVCDETPLRSITLAEIFVPLIGNYVASTVTVDHHLVNEAILATGRISKHLGWGAYYALVQKYLRLSREKDASERTYVRTLVALLENFHFPMDETVVEEPKPVDEDELEQEEVEGGDDAMVVDVQPAPVLVKLVNVAKIADAVNGRLLPNLLNHLEKRDTTEDGLRIPIAIGIVKVAKHLPEKTREPQVTRLLTVLTQILRSKSQETRDLTRDTLSRIAIILGSSYLPLIFREMRAALLRGPQLHVLAHVAHAILAHVTSPENVKAFETLDDCVSDVSYVSAEVIFGESGKDVQNEEFKTKMREVRSSAAKGLDSFAILGKFITPAKITALLLPLKSIMQETESAKVMLLVDDVLRRIAGGLNSNKHLVPAELIGLCHTLVSQNAKFLTQAPTTSVRRKGKGKGGDAIIQIKRKVTVDADHYANNSFRFVAFGLDLLNTALRRHQFDFRDAAIISRLESMVAVIGNTLYSNNAPVLVLGMKCAAAIVKCPLKNLGKSLPVFIRQIVEIIKSTGSTESDVVQTAFKSLAIILRDGPAAEVNEKDLVYLLELLSPDLEEPTRQASVFTMLRAIVSRKFVVPEIYDLMDKVSEIMVTSQSTQVQELCRGVLLQFLLDYPQGKGRLRNHMTFLAKNLSYIYESGRISVMELLDAILSKFDENLVRDYADLLFVALVMVLANDDSTKCREMGAELIKTLFTRLNEEHQVVIMSHLRLWSSQHTQPQLTRVSAQVYGLLVDVLQAEALPHLSAILSDLTGALKRSAREFAAVNLEEDEDAMDVDLEWQVPYHSLIVLSKVLRIFPDLTTEADKLSWSSIVGHLLFPHAWVRTASCRLLGLLFSATPVAAPSTELPDESPLSRLGMQDVANKLSQQLKSEHLDEPLSLQIVKNLFYIGKSFYEIPVAPVPDESVEDAVAAVEDVDESEKDRNPLPWLFSKLSYQVRSAHIARRNRTFATDNWVHQPASVFKWFAAMTSMMSASRLEAFLVHILTPVYRITEDDTIRDSHMDELKTLAVELQELVQSKVGVTTFSTTYNRIRQGVVNLQRERRQARVMLAATNPEASTKRKMQRNTAKKDSRKRKDRAFADGKGRLKRRREE